MGLRQALRRPDQIGDQRYAEHDERRRDGDGQNPRRGFYRLLRRRIVARTVRIHLELVSMHRRRDVLDLLLADIGEMHRQLVRHLLVNRARDADAADRRDALQARRDVDAVAKQVAVALDHIADGDADTEAHLPAGRIGHVAGAQAFLNIDGAADRLDGAGKFGKHGIAGGIEDAAAGAGDKVIHHAAVGREPPQRLLLVFGDELAVTGDVGGENGRDFSFHRTPAASETDIPSMPDRNGATQPAQSRRSPAVFGASDAKSLLPRLNARNTVAARRARPGAISIARDGA